MFGTTLRVAALFALAFGVSATAVAQDAKTKAAVCTACHGPDGNSVNPDWPKLAGQHSQYIVTQLQAFKAGQRKNANMNAMAAPLSDQDMVEIAAYFSAQAVKVGSVDAAAAAPGAALYRGGKPAAGVPSCLGCHGPNGAGNPTAQYPALRGQHAKYTITQLKAYKSGERNWGKASMMNAIAARLSDTEMEQLATYIEGLH